MSSEKVQAIETGVRAFNRRDWDAWLSDFHAEIEWIEMPSLGPDPSTYHGLAAVRQAVGSWVDMWQDYRFELVDCTEAGNDVVVLARERGQGPGGLAVEREIGEVMTFREGKVVRVRLFGTWAEARSAVGV